MGINYTELYWELSNISHKTHHIRFLLGDRWIVLKEMAGFIRYGNTDRANPKKYRAIVRMIRRDIDRIVRLANKKVGESDELRELNFMLYQIEDALYDACYDAFMVWNVMGISGRSGTTGYLWHSGIEEFNRITQRIYIDLDKIEAFLYMEEDGIKEYCRKICEEIKGVGGVI